MVRGINRHIIEIMETENEYYERAVLFVRPEHEQTQYEILHSAAKKMLRQTGSPSVFKKKQRRGAGYWLARTLPAALSGALLTAVLFILI
ncbi:MAG: hypothetical protein LBM65_03320 [Oscillospiraceae bacterium]|jgi:hypothetical protein|nr:hypothetical protein [Oscillospiraceae bacterium]